MLIVEAVETEANAMRAALLRSGMAVELASGGAEGIAQKPAFQPEIVVVDQALADMNALVLVRCFAAEGDCGIIVVTDDDQAAIRIAGLQTGADDYIVKPVTPRELGARIQALHRRLNKPAPLRRLRIFVDPAKCSITSGVGGCTLLSEEEMAALETLIDAEGSSVSRVWLSRVALKRALSPDDRAVDQLVTKMRRKIAGLGASERVILAARRHGYVIADPSLFHVVQNFSTSRIAS